MIIIIMMIMIIIMIIIMRIMMIIVLHITTFFAPSPNHDGDYSDVGRSEKRIASSRQLSTLSRGESHKHYY